MSTKKKSGTKLNATALAALVKLMEQATPTAAAASKKKTVKKSTKAQAIEQVLQSGQWGSSQTQDSVAKVVSILLGETVEARSSSSRSNSSAPFMVVVPVVNITGYVKGQPCMFKTHGGSHGICVAKDGSLFREDNPLPLQDLGNAKVLRFATKSEIAALAKKMTNSDQNISDVQSYVGMRLA